MNISTYLSKIPQTHMKKYAIIIGITVSTFTVGIAGMAYALSTPDYESTIAAQLKQVDDMIESARLNSCEYIGTLTNDCYKRKDGACSSLQTAEERYKENFGGDSYSDCFSTSTPEPVEAEPVSTSDSLFFGDEGNR